MAVKIVTLCLNMSKAAGKRVARVNYVEADDCPDNSDSYESSESSDIEEQSSDDMTLAQWHEQHPREIVEDPLDRCQLDSDTDDEKEKARNSVPASGKDEWIGRRVRRSFAGYGIFNGVIVSSSRGTGRARWFQVKYEDGDADELDAEEVVKYILPRDEKADSEMMNLCNRARTNPDLMDEVCRYVYNFVFIFVCNCCSCIAVPKVLLKAYPKKKERDVIFHCQRARQQCTFCSMLKPLGLNVIGTSLSSIISLCVTRREPFWERSCSE